MRFFNIAGPCDPRYHYMLPAAERLPRVPRLVERGAYFVVHAPRQTGKTTTLKAIAKQLTAAGRYAALHVSCEGGRVAGDDVGRAQRAVLDAISLQAEVDLEPRLRPPSSWPERGELSLLSSGLMAWARACERPLVLLLDEIDTLRGQSLHSILSQLRASYANRPDAAPWSVVLCGLRDVRDYKAASGGDPARIGSSSPFNIKDESMRLGDFTAEEVQALYRQHTDDTGQPFTAEAVERAFELSCGQPWLVNTIARKATEHLDLAPPAPITAEHVDVAKEMLILERATHLDSLVARLDEERVRRIIEPLIAGTVQAFNEYQDDLAYVRDLGLIAPTSPVRPANPIYREVIVRVLAGGVEVQIEAEPRSFVSADGRLDTARLLHEFAAFWREHGEILTSGDLRYHEVAPQLVLMAYLQRIVNGGGYIDREYGVGRGRIDLLVRWPLTGQDGRRQWQREALELKVWRDKRADPKDDGLTQLDAYLDRLGLTTGTLVLFDRRSDAPPHAARIRFEQAKTASGRDIILLRA